MFFQNVKKGRGKDFNFGITKSLKQNGYIKSLMDSVFPEITSSGLQDKTSGNLSVPLVYMFGSRVSSSSVYVWLPCISSLFPLCLAPHAYTQPFCWPRLKDGKKINFGIWKDVVILMIYQYLEMQKDEGLDVHLLLHNCIGKMSLCSFFLFSVEAVSECPMICFRDAQTGPAVKFYPHSTELHWLLEHGYQSLLPNNADHFEGEIC